MRALRASLMVSVMAIVLLRTAVVFAFTIPWETQSGFLRSGVYAWIYSYDIGFFDGTLMIDVDIKLTGDTPSQMLLDRWEFGIESIWSTTRFEIPILFNVDWVTTSYDYLVTVHSGSGNDWSMLQWYTEGAAGWGDSYQEEIVAHEYGHMISLWDEYAGGAVNPVTRLINTGGLMHTLNGPTLNAYYTPFLSWYGDHRRVDQRLPLPRTSVLMLAGLVFFALVHWFSHWTTIAAPRGAARSRRVSWPR